MMVAVPRCPAAIDSVVHRSISTARRAALALTLVLTLVGCSGGTGGTIGTIPASPEGSGALPDASAVAGSAPSSEPSGPSGSTEVGASVAGTTVTRSPSLLDATAGEQFEIGGLQFSRRELADLEPGSVEADYGLAIAPLLVDGVDGDLAGYRAQAQHVVNRLRAEAPPRRIYLLGARFQRYSDLRDGESIVATVLIDNPSRGTIVDLEVTAALVGVATDDADDGDGSAVDEGENIVAAGRFELDETGHGLVPVDTMLLTNLIFPPARIDAPDADLTQPHEIEATITWDRR